MQNLISYRLKTFFKWHLFFFYALQKRLHEFAALTVVIYSDTSLTKKMSIVISARQATPPPLHQQSQFFSFLFENVFHLYLNGLYWRLMQNMSSVLKSTDPFSWFWSVKNVWHWAQWRIVFPYLVLRFKIFEITDFFSVLILVCN